MDRWLSHPTALKIISVILGLLLWAVVHIDPDSSQQAVTSNIDIKTIEAARINTEGLDEQKFTLSAMEPTVVKIVVQGRISDLLKASSVDDYEVKVDLKDAKPGIQELPLILDLPKGIQLVEMSPRTVTVQLEEILTKPYELKVVTEGKPAEGYIAGTPAVLSETNGVQVTLPKDDMSRVGLVTAEVNVDGADKTIVNKKAKVIVYDTEGIEMTNAVVSPETVHVEVKVTPPFKTVPLQVRYSGSLPEGLSIVSVKPAIEQVTVYGEQKALDEVQVYDGAVLDLSKVKQSGTIQVKTQPLDAIKLIEPAEVTLDIVVAPTATRTFKDTDIMINGVTAGLTALIRSPETGKIDLTVSGAESVLSAIRTDEINVIADVEGLGPGVHIVPLQIDVPAFVQTVVGSGQSMTVSIEILDSAAAEAEQEDAEEVGGSPSEPSQAELPDSEGGINDGNDTDGTTTKTST
jgi:YbbR domain-containing protein